MLKRIACAIIATIAVVAALVVWRLVTTPYVLGLFLSAQQISGLLVESVPFVIALLILIFAIRDGRKSGKWLAGVLIVGAVSLFVARLHDLAIAIGFDFGLFGRSYLFVFPNCSENPMITMPLVALRLLALCVPVALFGYIYRAANRSI
jgi:hypothetical protein